MMIFLAILLVFGVSDASFLSNRQLRDPEPPYECGYCQPEQIHIAFGEKSNDIVVTWTTINETSESRVQYGINGLQYEERGRRDEFKDGRNQWIHRVTLKDLQYDTRYEYHCGSVFGWSERFSFKTPPSDDKPWTLRAAVYGDMGVMNAHSLSYLQDEAQRDRFDLILHVGDFAYDMYEDDSRIGDQFMRQIQPLAAIVPYMVCVGNHEENRNFSNYKARFSMPGGTESMFYSWDLGPVHFVAINTEAYYFLNYSFGPLISQYEWLQRDLEKASEPAQRSKRPWIVAFGHRPMYCSNIRDDCWNQHLPNRDGLPLLGLGLEPLLKQFGVDLVIWAHEHSYERTWPLYDEKVYNGSLEHPYVNPRAPVHVITGSAGCREKTDGFVEHPLPWSAFRSSDYGYTRFEAHNGSHIYIEQVSVDKKGEVIDSFWLIKDQHEPFYNLPAPVHLITGSAGCREGRDRFKHSPAKWSAFRSQDFGYTRFKAYNGTHINIEQVSVDLDGRVIDSFWLIKNKALSFNML